MNKIAVYSFIEAFYVVYILNYFKTRVKKAGYGLKLVV